VRHSGNGNGSACDVRRIHSGQRLHESRSPTRVHPPSACVLAALSLAVAIVVGVTRRGPADVMLCSDCPRRCSLAAAFDALRRRSFATEMLSHVVALIDGDLVPEARSRHVLDATFLCLRVDDAFFLLHHDDRESDLLRHVEYVIERERIVRLAVCWAGIDHLTESIESLHDDATTRTERVEEAVESRRL
jgi:hypothetical protein